LLFSDAKQGKKVFLTGYTHDGLNHIDSVHTIGIALTAMFHGETGTHSILASSSRDSTRQSPAYGDNAAFLVLEASHEADAASIGTIGQSEDRDYCLAIANGFKDTTREKHKHFLISRQIFLSFAMPSVTGFEEIGSCIVADHPSGKPLYVLSASITGRLSVSSPYLKNGPEQFAALLKHSAELDNFQTVFRLPLPRHQMPGTTCRPSCLRLPHWRFSWQVHAPVQNTTGRADGKDHSPKIHTYLERLRQRKEEHVLSYKFALIASFLALENLEETVTKFDQAKNCRNDIVHGAPFDEDGLPIAKVRKWLGELVCLHLALRIQVNS